VWGSLIPKFPHHQRLKTIYLDGKRNIDARYHTSYGKQQIDSEGALLIDNERLKQFVAISNQHSD
jgi:hypothetical protein